MKVETTIVCFLDGFSLVYSERVLYVMCYVFWRALKSTCMVWLASSFYILCD